MSLSRQELQAETEAAFKMFQLSTGAKAAPYLSDESNVRTLMEWIIKNAGEESLASVGAWQLAFANCELVRDESHPVLQRQRAAEQAAFVRSVNGLSTAELKDKIRTDKVFAERYQKMNEEAQALQTFQGLTERQIQDAIRFRPELKPVYQRFVEAGGKPVEVR